METKPADPVKAGCIFVGWYVYTDPDCTDAWSFPATVSRNTTLYAKWEDAAVSLPIAEKPLSMGCESMRIVAAADQGDLRVCESCVDRCDGADTAFYNIRLLSNFFFTADTGKELKIIYERLFQNNIKR